MLQFRKIVLVMIPVFIFFALFSSSSFAGGKKWKKQRIKAHQEKIETKQNAHLDWRDEIRYSEGHTRDCNLPPGLAKKGKVPPGWAKKCNHQGSKQHRKHHAKKHEDAHPDHGHKGSSNDHDKPSVKGGVDIWGNVHIPLP